MRLSFVPFAVDLRLHILATDDGVNCRGITASSAPDALHRRARSLSYLMPRPLTFHTEIAATIIYGVAFTPLLRHQGRRPSRHPVETFCGWSARPAHMIRALHCVCHLSSTALTPLSSEVLRARALKATEGGRTTVFDMSHGWRESQEERNQPPHCYAVRIDCRGEGAEVRTLTA